MARGNVLDGKSVMRSILVMQGRLPTTLLDLHACGAGGEHFARDDCNALSAYRALAADVHARGRCTNFCLLQFFFLSCYKSPL